MPGRLQGKTALITGASRGIGRAIAEAYGREGARVAVNYASNRAAADETVAAIKAAGGDALALQADTTDPVALRRLFAEADAALGGLDIVVANAHPGHGHALGQVTDEEIDGQVAVFKSFIIALQEAGRRVRDGGVIITISSGTTRIAVPAYALYSSVKLAVEQLSRSLSRELAPRGVRVVSLAPGLTRTDRIADLPISGPAAPRPADPTPFSRMAEPEEIADAAVFLASADARWVNTSTLYVTGGAVYGQ